LQIYEYALNFNCTVDGTNLNSSSGVESFFLFKKRVDGLTAINIDLKSVPCCFSWLVFKSGKKYRNTIAHALRFLALSAYSINHNEDTAPSSFISMSNRL